MRPSCCCRPMQFSALGSSVVNSLKKRPNPNFSFRGSTDDGLRLDAQAHRGLLLAKEGKPSLTIPRNTAGAFMSVVEA
jgi:hypothetical protein